jgi:hypothetical protein
MQLSATLRTASVTTRHTNIYTVYTDCDWMWDSGFSRQMIMIQNFWVVTKCRLAGGYHRFGTTCHFHLPWRQSSMWLRFSRRWSPEDGGRMFLWNVAIYLQVHTALQPGIPTSTFFKVVTDVSEEHAASVYPGNNLQGSYRCFGWTCCLNLPWK